MTTKLISAVLARNEADRFLVRVLARLAEFSDQILVLDDNSTDDTPKIAKQFGTLKKRTKPPMWGQESSARQELWDWACERAKPDDWLLIADADQVMAGNPRVFMDSWDSNTALFRLYDCWSETQYREDQFWQGHLYPRPWMVCPARVPPSWTPEWSERGIHTGHLPSNWPVIAPMQDNAVYWQHLGWASPELRRAKYERYQSQSHQLTASEAAHVQSILQYDT